LKEHWRFDFTVHVKVIPSKGFSAKTTAQNQKKSFKNLTKSYKAIDNFFLFARAAWRGLPKAYGIHTGQII
jgi:hypothetical protein